VEIFSCDKESWKRGESLPEKLLGLAGVVRSKLCCASHQMLFLLFEVL